MNSYNNTNCWWIFIESSRIDNWLLHILQFAGGPIGSWGHRLKPIDKSGPDDDGDE